MSAKNYTVNSLPLELDFSQSKTEILKKKTKTKTKKLVNDLF